jgi:hypothetical protein
MLFISMSQRAAMHQRLEDARCEALARRIQVAFEQELAQWTEEALRAQVRRSVARLKPFGIREEQFLAYFAIWDIFLGEGFEARDPDGRLCEILREDRAEPMKFHEFRMRLDMLLNPAEQPYG